MQYITVKVDFDLSGVSEVKDLLGKGQTEATEQSLSEYSHSESNLRSTLTKRQLKSRHNCMSLHSVYLNLCLVSSPFMCFPIFCQCIAGQPSSPLQRMAGEEKEGGREADACDSVGAVMRVPMMEKQSVKPEYTAHLCTHTDTHTHLKQLWSNGLAKAWGRSALETYTFTTHYMVNNKMGNYHHHCQTLTVQTKNQPRNINCTIFVKYSFTTTTMVQVNHLSLQQQ